MPPLRCRAICDLEPERASTCLIRSNADVTSLAHAHESTVFTHAHIDGLSIEALPKPLEDPKNGESGIEKPNPCS